MEAVGVKGRKAKDHPQKKKKKGMPGVRIELTIFGLLPLCGSHKLMRPTLYQLSQPGNVIY
jgi:hypothetical protein